MPGRFLAVERDEAFGPSRRSGEANDEKREQRPATIRAAPRVPAIPGACLFPRELPTWSLRFKIPSEQFADRFALHNVMRSAEGVGPRRQAVILRNSPGDKVPDGLGDGKHPLLAVRRDQDQSARTRRRRAPSRHPPQGIRIREFGPTPASRVSSRVTHSLPTAERLMGRPPATANTPVIAVARSRHLSLGLAG